MREWVIVSEVSEHSHIFEKTEWIQKKSMLSIFLHINTTHIEICMNMLSIQQPYIVWRNWKNFWKIDVFSIKKGNATYEISLINVLNWLGAMFLLLSKVTLCLINGWSHTLMFLEISDILYRMIELYRIFKICGF